MSVAFFAVPTRTMEDTVLSGDWLFVRRHGARGPGRGDVIVFRYPVDPNETFLQRVVGLPGDRIRIASQQLHVNGRKLDEPYATHKSIHLDSYRDNFPDDPNVPLAPQGAEMLSEHVSNGEVEIPPNRYFVLGDNRDSSWDSRYWGFVPSENIIGKPWIVYWSVEPAIAPSGKPSMGWPSFSGIRWRRILTPIRDYPI